jgi:LTXXQ motif family protein
MTIKTKLGLLVATATLAGSIGFASAQSPDPHHPDQKPAPTRQGMGPGGTQGGPGMMGGNMAGMVAMMQMMRDGMPMPMGMGPNAAQPFQHIEGQLAYWRAELRITDAQAPQWDAFAGAVRDNVKKLQPAMMTTMQGAGEATAPDQLDRRITFLTTELDAMRAVQAAAKPLYDALTADQKKAADQLMAEHMMGMRARGL